MVTFCRINSQEQSKENSKIGFVLELLFAMGVTTGIYIVLRMLTSVFFSSFSPVSGLIDLLSYIALLFSLGVWTKRLTREYEGICPDKVIQAILLDHLLFLAAYHMLSAPNNGSMSFSIAFILLALNIGFAVPLEKLWQVNTKAEVLKMLKEAYYPREMKAIGNGILSCIYLTLAFMMWIFTRCQNLLFITVLLEIVLVFVLESLRKKRIKKLKVLLKRINKEDTSILIWSSGANQGIFRSLLGNDKESAELNSIYDIPECQFNYIVVIDSEKNKQDNYSQGNTVFDLLSKDGIVIDLGYTKKGKRSLLFDRFGIPVKNPKRYTLSDYSKKSK